jgi:hypothetical protein
MTARMLPWAVVMMAVGLVVGASGAAGQPVKASGTAAAAQGLVAEGGSLKVSASLKAGGPAKEYPTRTVAGLPAFESKGAELDKYGGWLGVTQPATGFFYAKKIGERWWLVDPEGHGFIHVAVDALGPQRSPGFRRAMDAKYGTEAKWRDETVAWLREAGFNGSGAWSADALINQGATRLVHTSVLNFMSGYGQKRGGLTQQPGHMGYPGDCIFVFDPEFETFADEQARRLAANKTDPWLLGYFSDNELPFPADALDRYLKLPEKDPGRLAAEAWRRQRHAAADAAITQDDREAFRAMVGERYFDICNRAIKKYDPNHLYLGPRLHAAEKRSKAFFAAIGKSVDVIAVNVYGSWSPRAEVEEWAAWSGRPIMITEFYAKGMDSGMKNTSGAGWTVPTQADRGRFYQQFTLDLLESKGCVGWHWFKYADNDPEDLSTDPSNRDSNKGIVNGRYEPYKPLLAAMTELNRAVYPLTTYFDRKR